MPPARRRAWSRFVRVARPYFTSPQRRQALGLLALLAAAISERQGPRWAERRSATGG
jgi:hypothetical protein